MVVITSPYYHFKIQTNFGNIGYLGMNGPVASDVKYQWAYSGTAEHNKVSEGGDVFTLEMNSKNKIVAAIDKYSHCGRFDK